MVAPKRLTVMQLLPALQAGGVEQTTLEVTQALVQAGHRALVVSAGGRMVPRIEAAGGEHFELDIGRKSLRTLLQVRALRALIRSQQPDIVHARSRLPAWVARFALQSLPAASRPHWLTTVHGLNSPSAYSRVLTTGERVICVSTTVRDYVRAHYPQVPADRLYLIEPGMDPLQFPRTDHDARARQRAQWAQQLPALGAAGHGGPLLLLPGRGTRLKGHADGIRLLAALRAEHPHAVLWLLGADDPDRHDYLTELRALAAALGVHDRVVISPPDRAIASAMAAADLVLQLSRKPEAFGRTVIEALQTGTPVLGWDHGGVGALLRELYPQGAAPAFDETALAAQALQLLKNPPATPESVPYTLERMQQRSLSLYQDLMHNTP